MKCPTCGREVQRMLKHLSYGDAAHQDFLNGQRQLVIKHFAEDELTKSSNPMDFGIVLNYDFVKGVWAEEFTNEEIRARGQRIRSKHTAATNVEKFKDSPKNIARKQRAAEVGGSICPICGARSSRFWKHLETAVDEAHAELKRTQVELVVKLFDDLSFNKNCNPVDFGVLLTYSRCLQIWRETIDDERRKARVDQLNAAGVSKVMTGKTLTDDHKRRLSDAHLGQVAWNTGLTVDSDERVRANADARNKAMSKVLVRKYKRGEMKAWSKGLTKFTDKRIADAGVKKSRAMVMNATPSGRGISGIRGDIGHMAVSTYEANVYRIFQYEHKRYLMEFDNVFPIIREDGLEHNYRVDICDVDGLFDDPGTYIEIKGLMDDGAREKIRGFRRCYPDKKLIVIGKYREHDVYGMNPDVDYDELTRKYKPLIPLWEDNKQNLRITPELYTVNEGDKNG